MYATLNKGEKIATAPAVQQKAAPVPPAAFRQSPLWRQALPVQFSLKLNRPRDQYEQQAERIAEQVMRMQEPELQRKTCTCGRPAGSDGLCAACKQKHLQIQRDVASEAEKTPAPPIIQEALRSPGRPLDTTTRNFMESRLSQSFGAVRVHTDTQAAASAEAVQARAYTVGPDILFGTGQYRPGTTAGRKLLAHELTHIVQQSQTNRPLLQRDLALEPPAEVEDQPELSDAQVQAAIRYNRASYEDESIRLIQDLVGVEQTGTFDETTVRAVAQIQEDYGLKADGKVGADTYDLLIRELQAEGTTPGTCLTLFQIVGPEPLRFFRNTPTSGTIGSRFFIRARFDPRCNCEEFEYRQYIAGSVILDDITGVRQNLNASFLVPGGLRSTLHEDGDASIPAGVAGHHYGHRSDRPHPTDRRDRYLPDRRAGCEYRGHDFPELGPIPAAPGDTGDEYIWNMRFRGIIIRRGAGVVAEKYWAIRDSIIIM